MSEWWTYSPSDLLMFSARAYYRLFALHNDRLWPAQAVALAVGIGLLVLLRPEAGLGARRSALGLLATAWLVVAWTYFVREYSAIHTFANWFAGGFALEAMLLAAAAGSGKATALSRGGFRSQVGWAVLGLGGVVYPLIAPALGRPWTQAELFALTPDPTVIATFGALLLIRGSEWWLWLVPIGWAIYNGATLLLLHAPEALLLPFVGLAAVILRLAPGAPVANPSPAPP